MEILKEDIIAKVRIAIDEILPSGISQTDTFWQDQDAEIWQAVQIAAEQLCMELPREMLEPSPAVASGSVTATPAETGSSYGYIELNTQSVAPDYLGLYELKMSTWKTGVVRTITPGSAEALQQTNRWTCGTPNKPKAMEVREGSNVKLYYWSVGKEGSAYNHSVERLLYIKKPKIGTTTADSKAKIDVPMVAASIPYIIYRAGRLVMTAKKETALAQEFDTISKGLSAIAE